MQLVLLQSSNRWETKKKVPQIWCRWDPPLADVDSRLLFNESRLIAEHNGRDRM